MINNITLIGHIGKEPETRHLESGNSVTTFSLATNENYKDKKSGEWQTQTEWHNIVGWGKYYENRFYKGQLVYIEGKIKYRHRDMPDGNKIKYTDIVCSKCVSMTKSEEF